MNKSSIVKAATLAALGLASAAQADIVVYKGTDRTTLSGKLPTFETVVEDGAFDQRAINPTLTDSKTVKLLREFYFIRDLKTGATLVIDYSTSGQIRNGNGKAGDMQNYFWIRQPLAKKQFLSRTYGANVLLYGDPSDADSTPIRSADGLFPDVSYPGVLESKLETSPTASVPDFLEPYDVSGPNGEGVATGDGYFTRYGAAKHGKGKLAQFENFNPAKNSGGFEYGLPTDNAIVDEFLGKPEVARIVKPLRGGVSTVPIGTSFSVDYNMAAASFFDPSGVLSPIEEREYQSHAVQTSLGGVTPVDVESIKEYADATAEGTIRLRLDVPLTKEVFEEESIQVVAQQVAADLIKRQFDPVVDEDQNGATVPTTYYFNNASDADLLSLPEVTP